MKSKITVREAAQLTGKSRETINTATQDGTLSFSKNASGHKVIDISELGRVFEIKNKPTEVEQTSGGVRTSQKVSDATVRDELNRLYERIKHREETNETQRAERDRERRQLQEEIEHLRTTLEKAQEQHNKALLLLTDQRGEGAGSQDKILQVLRDQINAQKVWFEERERDIKRNARHDKAKEIEQMAWWKRGFGKLRSA